MIFVSPFFAIFDFPDRLGWGARLYAVTRFAGWENCTPLKMRGESIELIHRAALLVGTRLVS
jgi:hypothetical protein